MEKLPSPVAIMICKLLPDLHSLDALTRASPMFKDVFAYHGAEIVEEVMPITLHRQVIVLIRAHVLLHANPADWPKDPSLALQALYDAAASPLTRDTAGEAMIDTLQAFARIQALATAILEAKLDYIRTMNFEHLEDSNHFFNFRDWTREEMPKPRKYDIKTLSPPSWIEEHRVTRALLRITLFSDLAVINAAQQPLDQQPKEKPEQTSQLSGVYLWLPQTLMNVLRDSLVVAESHTHGFGPCDCNFELDEYDETWSSLSLLSRHLNSAIARRPTLLCIPIDRPKGSSNAALALLHHLHSRVLTKQMFDWLPPRWRGPTWPPTTPLASTPILGRCSEFVPALRRQTPEFFECEGPLYGKICYESQYNLGLYKSALFGTKWSVLRPSGLGFMDFGRLSEELELFMISSPAILGPPKDGRNYVIPDDCLHPSDYIFTLKQLYDRELQKQTRLSSS